MHCSKQNKAVNASACVICYLWSVLVCAEVSYLESYISTRPNRSFILNVFWPAISFLFFQLLKSVAQKAKEHAKRVVAQQRPSLKGRSQE